VWVWAVWTDWRWGPVAGSCEKVDALPGFNKATQNVYRNGAPTSSRCEQLHCEHRKTHPFAFPSHRDVPFPRSSYCVCGLIQHLVHSHLGRQYYYSSSSSRQEACISLRAQLAEWTAVRIRTLDQTPCTEGHKRRTSITCRGEHTKCRYVLTGVNEMYLTYTEQTRRQQNKTIQHRYYESMLLNTIQSQFYPPSFLTTDFLKIHLTY